ncbi:MAG TPA: hypothetical protein VKK31_22015 [Thermoanaerobaculia bacterium]|nr:hypothetical protein [Thermoanaerobaculia bacterium]
MKRALLFASLVAVLVLTFWIGGVQPAHAYESCIVRNGTPCSPAGSTTPCTTEDQLTFTCTCRGFHGSTTWVCPY